MDNRIAETRPRILHIGYPKTGTTSLQVQTLYPLFQHGYLPTYVGVSSDKSSPFRSQVIEYLRLYSIGRATEDAKDWFSQFARSPNGFIISIESLIAVLRAEPNQALVNRLLDNFPRDTEIVLTIRDNVDLLTSLYQQKVKTGFATSYLEFFFDGLSGQAGLACLQKKFCKLATDDLVENLLEEFDKVTVIDLNRDGYMTWLSSITGLSTPDISLLVGKDSKRQRRLNPSLSNSGVRTMERVNKVSIKLFPFLSHGTRQLRGPKAVIHQIDGTLTWWQLKVVKNLGKLKSAISKVLIMKAGLLRESKYSLPPEVRATIIKSFPMSKTAQLVAKNGGVHTFRSHSTIA